MVKIIVFLASLVLASLAYAEPPTQESVERLLAVTRTEKMLDGMLANVDQVMRQSMATGTQGRQLTPEQQRALDESSARLMQAMHDELSWNNMRSLYVQVYQETFTQEEIDGQIAFYESPAGAAFIEKTPVVMQKSMSIMQSRMAPMMERMRAAMKQTTVDEDKTAK